MSKIIITATHAPSFRPIKIKQPSLEDVLTSIFARLTLAETKVVPQKINIKESTKMENNKNTQLKKPQNPLEATIPLMRSSDYRERFIAEYRQLKIRYERLKTFNNKIEVSTEWGVGEIPKHDCPDTLLAEQQRIMGEYLHTLEIRAQIEGIDLSKA